MSDLHFQTAQLFEEARVRRSEGNITGAYARYRRLLEMVEARGDTAAKAELLAEMGQMYQDAYEVLDARRWYQAALALFRELGNTAQVGLTLFKLGQVEQLAGEPRAAEQYFREALEQVRAAGDPRAEGLTRASLGQLLWEVKREAEGVPEMIRGLTLLRECGAPEADHVRDHIRYWRQRISAIRYRSLITAATEEGELRRLLLE